MTIRSVFNDYDTFFKNVVYSQSSGDLPQELEEAIDQSTREEFEAELKRQCALRWLYQNGGITMDEDMRAGEDKARLLEERDVPDILEVLFSEEFYKRDADHIKEHLTRVAKGGFDRYSNNLVAERDGKAVGRVIVDTPYPPYAELTGLLVHPQYRRRGVGMELVKGCISLARQCNCHIMYLSTSKDNIEAHRIYSRFGFQPAMLQGFDEDEKEICLFRFSNTPCCYNEFLEIHPLSILSISGGRMDFHGNQAFEMRWRDPQTGDFLAFYMEGALLKSMPRITGIARREKSKEFDAWIHLISSDMVTGRPGEFEVYVKNKGEDGMNLHINYLLPKGTTIDGQPSNVVSLVMGEEHWKMRFDIAHKFDVPPLSFYTVLATCRLQIDGFSSPFPISAGFEVKRP